MHVFIFEEESNENVKKDKNIILKPLKKNEKKKFE